MYIDVWFVRIGQYLAEIQLFENMLHGNGALDWGDLHIPLGRSAVEGGEDGGGTRPASGRKRCLPRPSHLLMHFREERNRGRLPTFGLRPQEPIIQPRALGRRRTPIVQPDALSGPGKHSGQFWIWLGQRYSSWRRQRSRIVLSRT